MMQHRARRSSTVAVCLWAIAACGPSAEEQQACQTAKAAAAQAYDGYATRLTAEADELNELRTRSSRLLEMAEEMSQEQGQGGAGAAELVARTRATRAHHDARGELATAMTKTADVARRVAQAFRSGRVRPAMTVEEEADQTFTAIERASERVETAARTAGIRPPNRYGIEGPSTRSDDTSPEGLRLEIWRAAIESAQRAGQSRDESLLGDDLEIRRLQLDASGRAIDAMTACREVEPEE